MDFRPGLGPLPPLLEADRLAWEDWDKIEMEVDWDAGHWRLTDAWHIVRARSPSHLAGLI